MAAAPEITGILENHTLLSPPRRDKVCGLPSGEAERSLRSPTSQRTAAPAGVIGTNSP